MGKVLVKNGILVCSDLGQIPVGAGSSRLTVNGVPVVVQGQESKVDFTSAKPPCTNVTTSSPPSPAPCITQPATGGLAVKLSVGGQPVLLESAGGDTLPKVTPAKISKGTWKVFNPGQAKLTAT